MVQRFFSMLRASATAGASIERLSVSLAVGAYVAFSPFIGLHTLMIVVCAWLFRLNMAAMLIFSNIINNPWTFIPVYAAGYACGQWILSTMYAYDTVVLNPSWMCYINDVLSKTLGVSHISLWSFMVGGNLLGVIAAVVVYPVAKICIARARITSQTC